MSSRERPTSENGNDVKQADVATLEDVARMAGVSTATVSRCLNSPERVVEATKEKVLEAVRVLGYAPNFGARALAAKRTNTFGAIIPTMENAIFARGVQAFQESLGEDGITLLVASSSYQPELEDVQIRALVARGADALLLIGHDRLPESYSFLEARKIPFVVAWAYDEAAQNPSVGFDNAAAMKALAEEVIALGHRKLAFITAPRSQNDRARARYEGVCQALAEAGLPQDALHVVETSYDITKGGDAFEQVMQVNAPPTAVMCGNDVLAVGALKQARKMGLSVPDDVSITGFDDIEIAQIVDPALTTVHVPHREMGRRAAKMLVGLRNGAAADDSVALPASIVMRETLGPNKN